MNKLKKHCYYWLLGDYVGMLDEIIPKRISLGYNESIIHCTITLFNTGADQCYLNKKHELIQIKFWKTNINKNLFYK